MARCLNCIHCDVCDTDRCEKERLYGQCSDFLHDDDVVPKSEIAYLLSDLKKSVHDKAVYPHSTEVQTYINLKVFDGIIQNYLMKYAEERKE